MRDLTILYYTANRVPERFSIRIRNHLLAIISDTRVISISHHPMDFGHNVCVGPIAYGTYSIYKQILIGAMCATTPYVACCEDDAIYTPEHFQYRPPDGVFGYNTNKWQVNPDVFFHSIRVNMSCCVAPTDLMVEVLSKRYGMYPRVLTPAELHGWGEPGRKDHYIGLERPPIELFSTTTPLLTINHRHSSGGVRIILPKHTVVEALDGVGTAADVWNLFHGETDVTPE